MLRATLNSNAYTIFLMRDVRPQEPPSVRIRLPDGQTLVGGLLGWKRSPAGAWLGEVKLTVWQERNGGPAEAVEQQVTLPSAHVQPVEGVAYDAVRILGAAPTGTAESVGSVTAESGWPRSGDRWIVCRGRPGARLIHHADCWIPAGGEIILSGAEALDVLAEPGVSSCDICGVDRLQSGHRSDSPTSQHPTPI